MRHIMVLNPKGGCGKSTIATSLASYYAYEGYRTALVDYDPQGTSYDWTQRRPEDRPTVTGVAAWEEGLRHMPRNAEYVILDAPARSHGSEMTALLRRAESVIVPVLPSSIDMLAATKFLAELMDSGRIERKQTRVAVVANRVREYTRIFDELDTYLDKLKIPYLAALRDTQNYVHAYGRGLGIFELPEHQAGQDWDQWDPVIEWLESRRSLPRPQ